MPDIKTNPELDQFLSHPSKLLRVHTEGVMTGVAKRTTKYQAHIAALFHDFGKLNENFQDKLTPNAKVSGYSNHAYLSAYTLFAFCNSNKISAKNIGIVNAADFYSILTLIAHHHGTIPDFQHILSIKELDELTKFLNTSPFFPCSDFLKQWHPDADFDLMTGTLPTTFGKCCFKMPDSVLNGIEDRLAYFQETQFNFAALLESDKRDAGNNTYYRRDIQLAWLEENFSKYFTRALPANDTNELNQVRTRIRNDALATIKELLPFGKRVFSLTAPTGSGKTFTLIALADAIRNNIEAKNHSVLYILPFLTITEQVESICRKLIFKDNPDIVTRIDSRSQDYELEQLLKEIETSPEKVVDLLSRSFSTDTFDAAFAITTFVQFFETLLTNRNAAAMRLPNFSNCIFLIDEIQSLPPRLYIFFTAFLDAFCKRFDSYAILSTATMPSLEMPVSTKNVNSEINPHVLFSSYLPPPKLIEPEEFFSQKVFDRYCIQTIKENFAPVSLEEVANHIETQNSSCLIILNTIDDSRKLYDLLCSYPGDETFCLLNTRFTLQDRQKKIQRCQERLLEGNRIILISTQLIEAGVDIDFPVIYRDLAPLPSIIQSAGRCNRNGSLDQRGIVWLFELFGDNGKSRAKQIYRDPADDDSLEFSRKKFVGKTTEKELLSIQQEFFLAIAQNLEIGRHPLRIESTRRPKENLVRHINCLNFEVVGSFQLIDEKDFGFEYRYYVPENGDDYWEKLDAFIQETKNLIRIAKGKLPFQTMKRRQIELENLLQKMSNRVVTLRVNKEADAPLAVTDTKSKPIELCGLRRLLLPDIDYTIEKGIQTQGGGIAIF